MKQFVTILSLVFLCAVAASQGGQGGFGGGGFGGGGFGGGAGQGGMQQEVYDRSARAIDTAMSRYLFGDPIRNILTPEGFSEWPLTLKAGQVVIAEAWSDAFDPMLEIATDKDTVLATNDDRYPGDQRPVLLWRCTSDGAYSLRARSFRDKAGGQFFIRFKVYETIDVTGEEPTEKEVSQSFLLARVPMKAGQIKQVSVQYPNTTGYIWASISPAIGPNGLPDANLAGPLDSVATDTILAPVDGDYYMPVIPGGTGKLRIVAREIRIAKLEQREGSAKATAQASTPSVWSITVKSGQILEALIPETSPNNQLIVIERPDISDYDLTKPDKNPFAPKPVDAGKEGPAIAVLPGRARDGRVLVFAVKRDATILLASRGIGASAKEYTLSISPAPRRFSLRQDLKNRLQIGKYDYWTFDAEVGDVLTFGSSSTGFASQIVVRDPDFDEVLNRQAMPDENTVDWDLIVSKPGTYLVSVACIGDGGGGEYSLYRNAFEPKLFTKNAPATGELKAGDVHVLKFTARPEEPVLVKWTSQGNYSTTIRDDKGRPIAIPLTRVDADNMYGILKVSEPTTFLIVLKSNGEPSKYSIKLSDLPK